MKKFLVGAALAAMVCSSVSAQMEWHAAGNGIFVPFASKIGENASAVGAESKPIPYGDPFIQLVGAGSLPDVPMGFVAEVVLMPINGFIPGERLNIWAKPAEWVKLTVGKYAEDDLRGKIGTSDVYPYVLTAHPFLELPDEDGIFSRFSSDSPHGYGAHIAVTPIDGLYIGAGIPITNGGVVQNEYLDVVSGQQHTWGGGSALKVNGIKDAYREMQIGVGYKIGDTAHIRLQYLGDRSDGSGVVYHVSKSGLAKKLEAAVAFTGVSGVTIDVGVKVPLSDYKTPGDITVEDPFVVAGGVRFNAGDFDIWGRVDAKIGGKTGDAENGFAFTGYVVPSYNLGPVTLGVDVGLDYKAEGDAPNSAYTDMGFMLWCSKAWGWSSVKTGVAMNFKGGDAIGHKDEKPEIYIPISLGFFF
jgi:hypothetical protein